jgi:metallo-beta-lactamase family protein
MPRLTFHGAAETVTGSKYLLEADGARLLVDCGLFQGLKELRLRNWTPPPFDPAALDAVALTHAHIDHTGYLPALVRNGFARSIYCTPATAELANLLLLDSAFTQEEDAEYANRKGISKHKPALPLYDKRDAQRALTFLRPKPVGEWFQATGPIWCRHHLVGHLLGAGMLEVEIRGGGAPHRILFSGDVGRPDAPLYRDPTPPVACDTLICESTYGDRDHPHEQVLDELCATTQAAFDRDGVMLMASFAVGRAQQLIYLLRKLMHARRLPEVPIFLDSPMASDATAIYAAHLADWHDDDPQTFDPPDAFDGPNVHLCRRREESMRLNGQAGPAVIIASSGMMVGGRILHHLKHRAGDPRNTIVLGGFMAAGTRGRALRDGAKSLRIHGRDWPVRAVVTEVSSLSGHAGRSELLAWLQPLSAPRRVFLTHGELASANALAETLRAQRGWNVTVPKMGESVEL